MVRSTIFELKSTQIEEELKSSQDEEAGCVSTTKKLDFLANIQELIEKIE